MKTSPTRRQQRIETMAQSYIDKKTFSGIEWLVNRRGKIWSRGRVGQADVLDGREMAEKPLYRIYSMTKPIISAVAMMLMEQGKLRLFEPVTMFLPEFSQMNILRADSTLRAAAGQILIDHLLTHRAGLSYGFLPDCAVAERYRATNMSSGAITLAEMVRIIAAQPLVSEPGEDWRYSVSTDVLARVIEIVTGKELACVLDEMLFAPLGMSDTGFTVPEENRHRMMTMFGKNSLDRVFLDDAGPQILVPSDPSAEYPVDEPNFARGGVGLYSTLDDYMLFAEFLMSGMSAAGDRLLGSKTVNLMWTNRINVNQMPLVVGPIVLAGYGYSLVGRVMTDIGQANDLTGLGECGWAGAASTYFWIDPNEGMAGVVMAQYLGASLPMNNDIRVAVYQAWDD